MHAMQFEIRHSEYLRWSNSGLLSQAGMVLHPERWSLTY